MLAKDRKAWEKAQREKRIIDVAQEVFVTMGYERTTVPAIADAAGYNKRTIYLYFKDKEDVFLAVVLRCLKLFKDSFVKASRMVPENNIWLKEYAWAFFCFSEEYPEFMDLIMVYETRHFIYTEANKPDHHSERQAACQKISNDIRHMVTHTIEKALEQGAIVSDLTALQLMLILWGQIFGVIQILRIRKKNFEDAFELDRNTLFNHFVGMIQTALTK